MGCALSRSPNDKEEQAHEDLGGQLAQQGKPQVQSPELGTNLTFRGNRKKATGATWLTSESGLGA